MLFLNDIGQALLKIIGAAGHNAFSKLILEVSDPEYEGLPTLLKDRLISVADEYCYQNLRIQE